MKIYIGTIEVSSSLELRQKLDQISDQHSTDLLKEEQKQLEKIKQSIKPYLPEDCRAYINDFGCLTINKKTFDECGYLKNSDLLTGISVGDDLSERIKKRIQSFRRSKASAAKQVEIYESFIQDPEYVLNKMEQDR